MDDVRPAVDDRPLRFSAWVDFRAVDDDRLALLVQRSASARLPIALLALAQLFVVYLYQRFAGVPSVRAPAPAEAASETLMTQALAEAHMLLDAPQQTSAPGEAARVEDAPADDVGHTDLPASQAQTPVTDDTDLVPAPAAAPPAELPIAEGDATTRFFERNLKEYEAFVASSAQRLATLERREHLIFTGMYSSAVVVVLLLAAGVGLSFAGLVTVGVVTAAAGLVPGAGTVLFRQIRANIQADREAVRADDERARNRIDAIEAALAHPDPQLRARLLLDLSDRLAARALGDSAALPSPGRQQQDLSHHSTPSDERGGQ